MTIDPDVGQTNHPASLERYTYAGGDPINLFDPTGKSAEAGVYIFSVTRDLTMMSQTG
jgi:hypothetical protein